MRTIEMIKIGTTGEQLPADAKDHVAVLLPAHGVMFTARVINTKAKPQTALETECAAVECAGFTDWAMPEIDELQLVVDRARHSPAVNTDFFLDIPNDWLWSTTGAAWNKDAAGVSPSAWGVFAGSGYVDDDRRNFSGFALAVRRVGQ